MAVDKTHGDSPMGEARNLPHEIGGQILWRPSHGRSNKKGPAVTLGIVGGWEPTPQGV